jgi:uncharacterized protein with von Willebrand factor type A (vWA) domain
MEEKEKLSSDLLMITDGEAEVNDHTYWRVNDAKEKFGLRLHVLMVGGSRYYRSLEDVADTIIHFDNLDNVADTLARAFWLQ